MRNTSRVARERISTKVVAMEKEGAKFQDCAIVAGARGKMVYASGDADEGVWSAGQVRPDPRARLRRTGVAHHARCGSHHPQRFKPCCRAAASAAE
jgi:hypothetical protein